MTPRSPGVPAGQIRTRGHPGGDASKRHKSRGTRLAPVCSLRTTRRPCRISDGQRAPSASARGKSYTDEASSTALIEWVARCVELLGDGDERPGEETGRTRSVWVGAGGTSKIMHAVSAPSSVEHRRDFEDLDLGQAVDDAVGPGGG